MFKHFKPWSNECARKRETRRFLISSGILLMLGIAICLLNPILKKAYATMMLMGPIHLTRTYLLPLFYILLGWTIMQGAATLGMVSRVKTKASRPIHITLLFILLLYVVIMLPNVIVMIKGTIMQLQYMREPSLFPEGIHITSPIVPFLSGITLRIIDIVFKQPGLFVIPGVVLWLSRAEGKKSNPKFKG